MGLNVAVQMDPIDKINIAGNSTFALVARSERKGPPAFLLYARQAFAPRRRVVFATAAPLAVRDVLGDHFTLGEAKEVDLAALDVILLRQDPPFDLAYITSTHLLEHLAVRCADRQ